MLSPTLGDGGAATRTDERGRTSAEDSAEAQTASRFANSASGVMKVLGPVGQVAAAGLGAMVGIGARAASMGADLTSQMGVGHSIWPPDLSPQARKASSQQTRQGSDGSGDGDPPPDNTDPGWDTTAPTPGMPSSTVVGARPTVGASAAGGATADGAAAAGGSEAAAAAVL